jgi:hypothetical protein
MKVLVIGGMHGNEPLGIKLIEFLQKADYKNIDGVYANKLAIEGNCRFMTSDLNRSFPGDIQSCDYEPKRAAELLELCSRYDLVLDFHNTHFSGNDCSFVGQNSNQGLFDVSAYLRLRRVVVADYECINKYAPNCISVEISLDSERNDIEYWRRLIVRLSKLETVKSSTTIEKFKFVYRMTLDDKVELGLEKRNFTAFEAIDDSLAKKLGVASPAYPIFVADDYTPYNFGGLLNKIDV